jgi:hypothetical protein
MSTLFVNFAGNKASKFVALLFIALSFLGYKIWCRQVRRKVCVFKGIYCCGTDIYEEEDQYAAQMGCKAPRRWAAKWPQGLDLLLKAGQHARAQTILQFFLDVVDSSGPTHEQQLRRFCGHDHIISTDNEQSEVAALIQWSHAI